MTSTTPALISNGITLSKEQKSHLFYIEWYKLNSPHRKGRHGHLGACCLAATAECSLTYQIGSAQTLKPKFKTDGLLSNVTLYYKTGYLVAFSYRLDNLAQRPSVSFAVGLDRELVVQYLNEDQTGYYKSSYCDTGAVVNHFFADEHDGRDESQTLDGRVRSIGRTISTNYSGILKGTIRQMLVESSPVNSLLC